MPGKNNDLSEFSSIALTFYDNGSAGAGTTTPDIANGAIQKLTCSAATRTIAAPLYNGGVVGANVPNGTRLSVHVANDSGGALTLTWNAVFKVVNTAPGTGTFRVYDFYWDGTNWRQIGATADVTT